MARRGQRYRAELRADTTKLFAPPGIAGSYLIFLRSCDHACCLQGLSRDLARLRMAQSDTMMAAACLISVHIINDP
jgi:hypothetical protein